MKKIISAIMATALVASMSVTAFAADTTPGTIVDGDGASVTGFNAVDETEIKGDGVVPNTTFYYALGKTSNSQATSATFGEWNKIASASLDQLVDGDLFKFSVDKNDNAKMIKSISLYTEKAIGGGARGQWIKVVLNDSTTTSEMKLTGEIEFKAKKANDDKGNDGEWDSGATVTLPYTIWMNNTEKKTDEDAGTGDRIVFTPTSNEENSFVWGDDRAALKFEANDDASKFYARLSTKVPSDLYTEYGDPVDADLWVYDFVGNPTVPATSRATLTLGLGWDTDADYTPNPEDCYIYEMDADGVLTDVTEKFSYSEDAAEIEGWSIKTRTLGTYVISDTELNIDVVDEEVDETPEASKPTTEGDKEIPNTGSSDMVNVAVVAAVVSLAAAGAVAFRKVK